MASSSSSPSVPVLASQSWKYDVFLSFRGEDVRKKFVDHLYTALVGAGIHTYKEGVTLPRGESISPALIKAIEKSQIAVIIFSKNYANSTWCLEELTHIIESRDYRNQTVMPIFYDVEPTEVRKQKGTYEEAFEKHELENKEKVESWRKSLVKACNYFRWGTNIANGHEAQGIKQIVAEISQRLKPLTSGENEKLIGTHQINLLNNDEAVKLFCKHAHGYYTPIKDFEQLQLTKQVVSYAGGLPLALTVLGAFLCGRNVSHWRNALDRLKEIPDKNIQRILRISFDGLEQDHQELFLDIACFFRGKGTRESMELLDACGFYPDIGVEVLRQQALIVITEGGYFNMHDLVQEMGHYIVRGEHPRNPEKHSRVWKREDVLRILAMDAKTELDNIEAMDLEGLSYEESQRFLQVAGNMNKLRWIDLRYYGKKQRDGIIVPLPENFPPPQLCYLSIRKCIPQKQLWEGYKDLPNLRHMKLCECRNLIKIPDLSGLPNLETFQLRDCPSLEEIHPSIGRLERLVFLSIQYCPCLRKFPSITRIKKLKTLEFSFCYKLEIMSEIQQEMANVPHNMNRRRLQFSHSTLRKLDLRWCSLGDEEIGSDVWELPNLEQLDLKNNTFSRLDFSNLRLPRLKWLNVSYCISLVELSELPSSIAVVIADGCWSLESFGDISNCKWLWKVSLYGENKLDVDTLIHSMLQGNAIEDHFINVVLENQLPTGFVRRLFSGNIFRLHLPDDWYNDFSGFLICVVTNMRYLPHIKIKIGQEDRPFDLSHESDEAVEPIYGEWTKTCIGYVSFSSLRRHTTLLTSSFNIISVTIKDVDSVYGGIELIPGKSKSDEVQTTDSSQFWDEKLQDAGLNTFTIQQNDSDSSVEISWKQSNG